MYPAGGESRENEGQGASAFQYFRVEHTSKRCMWMSLVYSHRRSRREPVARAKLITPVTLSPERGACSLFVGVRRQQENIRFQNFTIYTRKTWASVITEAFKYFYRTILLKNLIGDPIALPRIAPINRKWKSIQLLVWAMEELKQHGLDI